VHQLAFDEHDVIRARISYEIDCAIDPGLFLRGTFSWHSGDDTPPARWMIAAWPPVAPAPLPAPAASVTFVRESSRRQTWDTQAADRIPFDTSGGGLKVHASPGTFGQAISLTFYTPPTRGGVALGVYPSTRRLDDPDRQPSDVGMDVTVDDLTSAAAASRSASSRWSAAS
jgi:hypothetical protein